jgi:putative membrane protein
MKETVNKDLILRERLALQRTILANQTTVLAFLYCNVFFCCWFEYQKLLKIENSIVIEYRFILLHSLF